MGIRRRGHLLGKVWKFSRWDMWWRVDEHAILTAWKSLASSSKWMHKRWLMHFHLLPHNVSFNLWTQQCFRTDACPQTNKGSVCVLSRVRLFVTSGTVARQAPLSMGFSRQGYWSGLPCPPPGHLPHPGMEPTSLMSPELTGGFFTNCTTRVLSNHDAMF